MNSVCSSLLPPSNRRRCVKKPTYNETSDVLGEIVNDNSNYSFNPSDYEYVSGENVEDGDEEQVTIDLSDFLNENPLLTEPSTENAPEAVDGIDSSSQFRVTNSQLDFNATAEEVPSSKVIEREEKLEGVDDLSNSISNCIITDKTENVVDSHLPSATNIKDEVSIKENILSSKKIFNKSFIKAKPTKSLSNPLRKYKNFIKTKELNKTPQIDSNVLGTYPVVKCEKLNIENLVKENKIKIGNWPLNLFKSKNKAKILVSKNSISSKRVSIPKFAVKSTRVFKKPISINKYVSKNKNGSPFNKMNSILVDSFDAMAKSIVINTDVWKPKVGGIYSNSNLLTNFRLPPPQKKSTPSNTKIDQNVKIIKLQSENKPFKDIEIESKTTMVSTIHKSTGKQKVFQLISQKQPNETHVNCASNNLSKPIIETTVTPPPVSDYTVIEPYIEDPTSPVKPKPILTVPIEILPPPEPLKEVVSFTIASHSEKSKVKPLKKPPLFLSSRPKKLQNLCAKFKEKPFIKNSDLTAKTHTLDKNTSSTTNSLIENAKDVVVNAMESVFSSNQNVKVVKSKRNSKKTVEISNASPLIHTNVCKAYNSTLNDILFGTDEVDPFTDLESSFTSYEEFSSVNSESSFKSIDTSNISYDQGKSGKEVPDQHNGTAQNVVPIHHKHMKKVKYKRKKANHLPCGSDTLSASEGESASTTKENYEKKQSRKTSYSKTIEKVVKSSSPAPEVNSKLDASLTDISEHSKKNQGSIYNNSKEIAASHNDKTANLNSSLKATNDSSNSKVGFVNKPLGLRSRRKSIVPKLPEQVSEISQRTRRKLDMNVKVTSCESPNNLTQGNKQLHNSAGSISVRKITNNKTKYLHLTSQNRKKQAKKTQVKPQKINQSKVFVKNKSKPQDIIQEIKTITGGSNISRTKQKRKRVSSCNKSSNSTNADKNNSFSDSELESSTDSSKKHCGPHANSKKKRTLKVLFRPNKRKTVSNCLKIPPNAMSVNLSDANSSSSMSENNENLNSTFRKGKEDTMDTSSSELMKNEIDVSVHESELVNAEIGDNVENSEPSKECQDMIDSSFMSEKSEIDPMMDVKLNEISGNDVPNNLENKSLDGEIPKNNSDIDDKDESLPSSKKVSDLYNDDKITDTDKCASENVNTQIDSESILQAPNLDEDLVCTSMEQNKSSVEVIDDDQNRFADCDTTSCKNLQDKDALPEVLGEHEDDESKLSDIALELQVKNNVENVILDSGSVLKNESECLENKSQVQSGDNNLETESNISMSATKDNESEEDLCVENENNILKTFQENTSRNDEIGDSSVTKLVELPAIQTKKISEVIQDSCKDIEKLVSTLVESSSEIQSHLSAKILVDINKQSPEHLPVNCKTSDVLKPGMMENAFKTNPCIHLESEPYVLESLSEVEKSSEAVLNDLQNEIDQLVTKTGVKDKSVQQKFGNKPENKKLKRKKCPKIKISVAKDTRSNSSRNTRSWYVSERKESTDSVMSDISELGATKDKAYEKALIHTSNSSSGSSNVIKSENNSAQLFVSPNESSVSISNDSVENQYSLKTVSIKLEPVKTDLDLIAEKSKKSSPKTDESNSKANRRKSKKINFVNENSSKEGSTTAKTPNKGTYLKTTKSECSSPASQTKPRKRNYCPEAVAVPFTLGWVRELVHRASESSTGKRTSDVYYFSPDGTKLRSMPDISSYITRKKEFSLSAQNFTFAKELIYREPFEIERSAKQKSAFSSPASAAARKSLPKSTKKTPSNNSSGASTPKNSLQVSPKRKKNEKAASSSKKITSYLSSENKTDSSVSTEESTSNTSFNISSSSVKKRSSAKLNVVKDSSAMDTNEINQKDISEDDNVKSRPVRRITKKIPFDNSLNEKNSVRKKRHSIDVESKESKTDVSDNSSLFENAASSSTKKNKTLIVKLPIFSKTSKGNIVAESPLNKRNERFSSSAKRSKTEALSEKELYLLPRCSKYCSAAKFQKPTIRCTKCLCYFHESCIAPAVEIMQNLQVNTFTCKICMYEQSTNAKEVVEEPQSEDVLSKINAELFYPESHLDVEVSKTETSIHEKFYNSAVEILPKIDPRTPLQIQAPVLNSMLMLPSPVRPSSVTNVPQVLDVNKRTFLKKIIIQPRNVIFPDGTNLPSPSNASPNYHIRRFVPPVNFNSQHLTHPPVPIAAKVISQHHVRPPVPSVANVVSQQTLNFHTANSNYSKTIPVCSMPSSFTQPPVQLKTFVATNVNNQNVTISSLPAPNCQVLMPPNSNFAKNICNSSLELLSRKETPCYSTGVGSENSSCVSSSTTKTGSDVCSSDATKSALQKSSITYSMLCNIASHSNKRPLEDSQEVQPSKMSHLLLEKNAANENLSFVAYSDKMNIPEAQTIPKQQVAPTCIKNKGNYCDENNVSKSESFRSSYDMCSFFTTYLHFLDIFKRLSLADLLRVKRVSRGWHHFASHNSLYEKMNFHGIKVSNWENCCQAILRHSAKSLNLSGIQHEDKSKPWEKFKKYLSFLLLVKEMTFDYISPKDIYVIADKMNQLLKLECHFVTNIYTEPEMFNSSCEMELSFLRLLGRLEQLWLGSPGGIILDNSSRSVLPYLPKLKHLTLTGFKFSSYANLESLSQLQELITLELGSCSDIEPTVYDLICALTNLKRLRLENGGSLSDTKLSKAISSMTSLEELELMNFKVPISLPDSLLGLQKLKHFNIWPDTSSEGPQVNTVSLDAVCKCKYLKYICWGVITEENTLPEILELQDNEDPSVIKELTFEQLFKTLVELFPGKKVRVQCVPRHLWGEFCCKRE